MDMLWDLDGFSMYHIDDTTDVQYKYDIIYQNMIYASFTPPPRNSQNQDCYIFSR